MNPSLAVLFGFCLPVNHSNPSLVRTERTEFLCNCMSVVKLFPPPSMSVLFLYMELSVCACTFNYTRAVALKFLISFMVWLSGLTYCLLRRKFDLLVLLEKFLRLAQVILLPIRII